MDKYYCRYMHKTSPKALFSVKRRNAVEARAFRIGSEDANFLSKIAAETLKERLAVINRNFDLAVDFLSTHNAMVPELERLENVKTIKQIVSPARNEYTLSKFNESEAELVPLKTNSANLITSVFSLHRSNDLPGSLIQIRKSLVNDGLFMAAIPGDNTLRELRECMIEAESEVLGSASLRVEPFGEIRQLGGLLQRAGFALPVADSELLTVRYNNFKALIMDLRAAGAISTLARDKQFANRAMFKRAEEIYSEKYQEPDGKIIATVEMIFLSGWAPDESQQQPLKPGSAKADLKDFL